jgi:2-polyprenyl-6-methoxyphenol hydroxylase-like FAD-dependent oxidoreductase
LTDQRRILVVGAGVAGLALARAGSGRAIDVSLIERRSDWEEGTGMYLPGNAVRALKDLGVADRVLDSARSIRRRRYLTARGRTLFEIDVEKFWQGVATPVGVHRSQLHAALRDGLHVQMGVHVAGLAQHPGGVDVAMSDGRQETYDLVVGADGVHSAIREMAFGQGAVSPATLGSVSWRFVVPNIIGADCWTVWSGPRALLLVVPIDDDRIYVFASLSVREAPDAQVRDRFNGAYEAFDASARRVAELAGEQLDRSFFSPLETVTQTPWSSDRVILIGDAAHAMAPTMAQGAALAIEDSLVLARLLLAGEPVKEVVRALEERRRRRVEWVRDHTERQARILHLPYWLRNLSAGTMGRRIWMRSFSILRDPY